MKYLFYIFLSALLLCGCKEPAPVEVSNDVQDDESYSLELLSNNINDELNSTGVDTSGTIEDIPEFSNYIVISGLQKVHNNTKNETFSTQAVFYDKTKPVRNYRGKLVSYHSKNIGNLSINNHALTYIPNKIKFRWFGGVLDSLIGGKYFLHSNNENFDFQYNNSIKLRISNMLFDKTVDIPVPPEISGNVSYTGKISKKNSSVVLKWNRFENAKKSIDIVVSGQDGSNGPVVPLFQIKTQDDGNFKMPTSFIEEFPFDKFNKIIFTFVRSYVTAYENTNIDTSILTRSVYRLVVDI